MRILVFFDLPTESNEDKRNYRRFRKMLIENGFIMMQESIYTRLIITPTSLKPIENTIKKNKPPLGIVQLLTITEKQFESIEYIVGEHRSDIIDNDERLIIL